MFYLKCHESELQLCLVGLKVIWGVHSVALVLIVSGDFVLYLSADG